MPPLTAAQLDGAVAETSVEANPLWMILAGQGPWGAAVMGIAALLYRMFRPMILTWMAEKKLERLYLAAESSAALMNVTYVEGMKKANADGRLTQDEKLFVFAQCKSQLVQIMKTQGVDIIKEYGDDLVNGVIELVVSRLNIPAPMKAVLRPLSASAQPPFAELQPVTRASTGEGFGLPTPAPARG